MIFNLQITLWVKYYSHFTKEETEALRRYIHFSRPSLKVSVGLELALC